MYYPYLRGKQFDLLALKEALSRGLLSNKIHPVIEPVRDSATLKNVIELFQKKHHPIAVIQNPQVGQFKLFDQHVHSWTVKEHSSVVSAQILTPENLNDVLDSPPTFLIFDGQHYPKDAEVWKQLAGVDSKFLIPDASRFRIWLPENKIVIRDSFQTRKHVESYADKTDDFFSDDYLFFHEDGYSGFSDFTIEGSRYFDKGFPSRALAIHLTYIDAYSNIRVKHFVSDSNDSAKDQALKFLEAGDKMKKWIMRHHHQLLITSGMIELLALYQQQKFPGLGVLKKWSLMHHLELISQLLDHPKNWLRSYSKVPELYEVIQNQKI